VHIIITALFSVLCNITPKHKNITCSAKINSIFITLSGVGETNSEKESATLLNGIDKKIKLLQ
jgi:hypothetical protein